MQQCWKLVLKAQQLARQQIWQLLPGARAAFFTLLAKPFTM
jgi:hypothetical protein